MADKVTIALCMGSSCFARGNNVLLERLEDLIKDRGWEDKVALSGLRCEDRCSQGPNMKIDGVLYQGIDDGVLLDLLESLLGSGTSSPTRTSVRRRVGHGKGE
ncbi:MAG: (2Fe-2S) ferredoxin domain-containing protein [Planctomycetes bacterium]|nr:(2Fe-2S) ferredoxin domain-containing protein [Planctomycetota bacterium]